MNAVGDGITYKNLSKKLFGENKLMKKFIMKIRMLDEEFKLFFSELVDLIR